MTKTFKGGLHIDDNKKLTNRIPIKTVDGSKFHIFPLNQHIGAPLKECVKVGDYVKVGDLIADNEEAFVSAPLHSSVSGNVVKIEPRVHPSGVTVTSIVIENDGKYELSEKIKPQNPDNMSKEEIIKVIRQAGIIGMGGAGFPTHVKLSPPKGTSITHVIVNAAECEPYLTSDHRRLLEIPEEVIDGLKIAMKALGLDKGYIGIELNKKDAISVLKEKTSNEPIEIVPLKTKYPQGAEKQLIFAITKRQVPSGKLPADCGCVVINVDTAVQISKAFRTGLPLIERIVTVSGDCVKEPKNLSCRTGMLFEDIFNEAGGLIKEPKKVIMGGPMMGLAQFSVQVPVVKTTSALLAMSEYQSSYSEDSVCIKCGKCVEHCPMKLMPLYMSKFSQEGNVEMALKYNVPDCIECGICSYICPSKVGQLNNIRLMKQKINELKRQQKL